MFLLLGALLPDIDEHNSKIKKWFGIFGSIISFFSKHRGLFHSFFLSLVLFLLLGLWNWSYAFALLIGYLSHLLLDGLTPMGIMPFYPFSKFRVKGPFRTGSVAEVLIVIGLIILIVKEFL